MSKEQKSSEEFNEQQECQDGQPKTSARKHKVLWLAATLACVAALIAGVQLTLGAFTANDFLKAVAVTGTSQDLFASDVLAPYNSDPGDSPVLRSTVVDTSRDKCSFTFRIYNCLLDDTNVFNDKEVEYTLSVTAKDASGNETTEGWSISPAADSYTFSVTRGEIKSYTVTLSKDLVDNASFLIKATVDKDNSPGTSKYCLAARVAPVKRSDANAASVSGSWVDANSDGDNVVDYAAYNYRITVTGEEKTVRLTWGDKVELDSHFEANHPSTDDLHVSVDRTNRTATFTVKPGSEIVNFYRVGSDAPASWDDLGVKVEEATS